MSQGEPAMVTEASEALEGKLTPLMVINRPPPVPPRNVSTPVTLGVTALT